MSNIIYFDLGDMFRILYDIFKKLAEYTSVIWNFINDTHYLGFEVPLIGFVGITITPIILISAGGILTLLVWWLIKSLVPFL